MAKATPKKTKKEHREEKDLDDKLSPATGITGAKQAFNLRVKKAEYMLREEPFNPARKEPFNPARR